MQTSPIGRQFIRDVEGESLKAYQDQRGIWTIGVGHTGPEVKAGMVISKEASDALLIYDLRETERAINRLVKVALTQQQFDALASFVFNEGATAFRKSTMLKFINKGDHQAAAKEFLKWNKIRINGVLRESNGLARRRAKERNMYLEGTKKV